MKKSKMKLMACVISSAVMFMAGGIIGQSIKVDQAISVANATTVGTGMSLAQLAQKALAIIPGTVTSQKFDYEDGVKVAEFDIRTPQGVKREISLRASDGSVWDIDSDYDDKGNKFIRQDLFKVNVTFEQAQQAALAKVAGGTVLATKQDADNGRFVYEFIIKAPNGLIYEVDVETQGGTVIKFEMDDDFDYTKYIAANNMFSNTGVTNTTATTTPSTTTQTPTVQQPAQTPAVTQPQAPQATQVASGFITQEQAKQKALKAVPGTVLWVEYDWDDGAPEWKFNIRPSSGYGVVEVEVNGWGYVTDIDWD